MFKAIPFSIIDLLALGYVIVAALHGLKRGLSGELAGFGTTAVAFFVGWRFHGPLGEWFSSVTRLGSQDSYMAGFVISILGVALVLTGIRWAMKEVMELSFKPALQRIGGLLAGGLRGSLIVLAIFIAFGMCGIDYLQRRFTEESVVGSLVVSHVMPYYASFMEAHPDWELPIDRSGEDGSPPEPAPDAEAR